MPRNAAGMRACLSLSSPVRPSAAAAWNGIQLSRFLRHAPAISSVHGAVAVRFGGVGFADPPEGLLYAALDGISSLKPVLFIRAHA
jgi:hypothetical protein